MSSNILASRCFKRQCFPVIWDARLLRIFMLYIANAAVSDVLSTLVLYYSTSPAAFLLQLLYYHSCCYIPSVAIYCYSAAISRWGCYIPATTAAAISILGLLHPCYYPNTPGVVLVCIPAALLLLLHCLLLLLYYFPCCNSPVAILPLLLLLCCCMTPAGTRPS